MVEDVDTQLVGQRAEAAINARGKNHHLQQLQQNGTSPKRDVVSEDLQFTPPDGGTRAWLVMVASFFCNGILFGVINSYSVLYDQIHDNFVAKNVTNPDGKTALVGSLAVGTTFFISPVSGVLTDYMGLRTTSFLGGLIASGGMFLASFCVDNVIALCVTYGVMYGLGGALAYTPSLAVLGHYFKRYLGLVNGLVAAGSSTFTIAMPYVIDYLIRTCGIRWTLRVLALLSGFIMLSAFLFKPIKKPMKIKKVALSDIFNVSVVKNRKYMIWAGVISLSLFGYFIPYVYMLKFVKENFPDDADGKLPVLCIGVSSGIGRLVFGYVADLPRVDRIFLQQISFLSIGILTILLPFSAQHFNWMLVITLGMGLFDGCFISLLGPIAFDICGRDGATQAIGFLLGLCAIPLTLGPYIAGHFLDQHFSFKFILILAGIPPALGFLAMFLIRCVKTQKPKANPAEEGLLTGQPHHQTQEGKL